MRSTAAFILLSACAAPVAQDHYDCGCVQMPTDEESIAQTGFPDALALVVDGYAAPDEKGLTHLFVQYDATKATPAMVAAAPAALCKAADLTLVSSRIVPPGPEDLDTPGSMIVKAICK